MKALKLVVLGIALLLAGATQAQISVRFSIGSPPEWGPSGYSNIRYYYLPDVQAYYDVETSMFIYFEGRSWIHRSYLPLRYRDYDLYNGYKVVLNDYHGNTPYAQFSQHRKLYAKGYHKDQQRTIGNRPGIGNHKPGNYRENNPANRGRYSSDNKNVRNDRTKGDNNYDKRGTVKNNDRGRSSDKSNKK
jgi:hypothetical protein